MTHPLYDVLSLLEREHLYFRIDRHRPDTVMITVTVVGERLVLRRTHFVHASEH